MLDPFAVEQLDARIVRRLHSPIGDQRVDVSLAGAKPQIALAVEVDRRDVAIDRHQGFELAVDLVPVLRHADVLGHGEQLADAAGGARGGGEFIGRIGLDHDDVRRRAGQCQVIGDRRADDPAANDRDLRHISPRCRRMITR